MNDPTTRLSARKRTNDIWSPMWATPGGDQPNRGKLLGRLVEWDEAPLGIPRRRTPVNPRARAHMLGRRGEGGVKGDETGIAPTQRPVPQSSRSIGTEPNPRSV